MTTKTPADWCGPLYQNANRLAHIYWLRSLGFRAWLVHLLFVDDKHGATSEAQWEAALLKTMRSAASLSSRRPPRGTSTFRPEAETTCWRCDAGFPPRVAPLLAASEASSRRSRPYQPAR